MVATHKHLQLVKLTLICPHDTDSQTDGRVHVITGLNSGFSQKSLKIKSFMKRLWCLTRLPKFYINNKFFCFNVLCRVQEMKQRVNIFVWSVSDLWGLTRIYYLNKIFDENGDDWLAPILMNVEEGHCNVRKNICSCERQSSDFLNYFLNLKRFQTDYFLSIINFNVNRV